jgi:F420-non-reducing hydrogenase small subunit
MDAKLKVGAYSAAGCGGCDIALLEIGAHILDLVAVADIVFWPTVVDFKYDDVRAMPDGGMDVCLFNGSIRTEENREIAELLRAKSKVLVAFGACSAFGGVPGLANLFSANEVLERAFSTESVDSTLGMLPSSNGDAPTHVPGFRSLVSQLSDVVDVDYVMPGCPPSAEQVWAVLQAVISGELPEAPAIVGAGNKSVCDECELVKEGTRVTHFVRSHQLVPDPERCLLEQGIVCMGPATRSGCKAQCTTALMPCRGCYGPAGEATDQGAKMIATLGMLVDSEDEQTIAETVGEIVDPAGTFYCFTLPTSLLGRGRSAAEGRKTREGAK